MSLRPLRVLLLVVVWMVLWRDVSWANALSGAVVATLVTTLYGYTTVSARRSIRPVPLLRYLAHFTWSVVKANFVVAWEVVTPKNSIREGVIAVELVTDDPVLITIISHSIGLAPGTMVIDVQRDPTILYVHSLHMRSFEEERADVRHLERLVMEAFDPSGSTSGATTGESS